ncbi:MAG: MASE3 domain-containing protein, partial [Candidatus Desulfacyla sp.]
MNTHNKEAGSAPAAVQKGVGEDAGRAYQDLFRAKRLGGLAVSAVILFGLYLSTLYSYLLFHTLVELFSIVVGCGIFIIAWNSRRLLDNNYLLFLGIAYLFVAFLDLIHTLAYKGMPVFQGYGADLPTQLWIAARYIQSLSLLIAPFFLRRRLRSAMAFGVYSLLTLLVLASLFLWPIFPSCFIEGRGLSPFKKISEYIISAILLAALAVLFRNRDEFDRDVFQWLSASIGITIVAELAFTFYVSVYGISNMVGHFCKLISFYLIYKAIIQTGLKKPYDLLFRNLRQSEQRLSQIIDFLPDATFVIDG